MPMATEEGNVDPELVARVEAEVFELTGAQLEDPLDSDIFSFVPGSLFMFSFMHAVLQRESGKNNPFYDVFSGNLVVSFSLFSRTE